MLEANSAVTVVTLWRSNLNFPKFFQNMHVLAKSLTKHAKVKNTTIHITKDSLFYLLVLMEDQCMTFLNLPESYSEELL